MSCSPQIQVLQGCVDENQESEFRVLVDNKHVKYITIHGGLYSVEDMCFAPTLIEMLPPLPSGNWNEGRVSRNTESHTISFTSVK